MATKTRCGKCPYITEDEGVSFCEKFMDEDDAPTRLEWDYTYLPFRCGDCVSNERNGNHPDASV